MGHRAIIMFDHSALTNAISRYLEVKVYQQELIG